MQLELTLVHSSKHTSGLLVPLHGSEACWMLAAISAVPDSDHGMVGRKYIRQLVKADGVGWCSPIIAEDTATDLLLCLRYVSTAMVVDPVGGIVADSGWRRHLP